MEQALQGQEIAELGNRAAARQAHARSAAQLPPLEEPIERMVQPAKRRVVLKDLIRHGSVIRVMTARDFKAKYKQAMLGPIWLFVQPLVMLLAFLIAFRGVGKVHVANEPYAVFALIGLSVWTFFAASLTLGSSSILSNSNFIRFTPVPRVAFPVAAVIASLPSFAITATAMIIAAAASGHLSARVLLLPFGLVWLLLLTAGTVGVLSSVTVQYRDVTGGLPFILGLGVFFVPVGYALAILSPVIRTIVELNPLTGIIEAWRWMVLPGYGANLAPIVISLVLTALVATIGWRVFTRLEPTMADVI